MNHPYKEFEDSKNWKIIKTALNDLVDNQDIQFTTAPEYIIGYLCKKLTDGENNHT